MARYLIEGVEGVGQQGTDEFLFLHNTTLPLAARDGDLAQQRFAETGPPIEDLDGLRASLAR